MVFYLCAGVFLLLSQNALCRTANYYYDSFGPNILFNDEGAAVETASGKDFLTSVSTFTCAKACYTINSKCGCCNSFAYNPGSETCYLKKRSNNEDISRYTGSNGYQSYKFAGFSYQYDGQLPTHIFGTPAYRGTADLYRMAFISKGNNMNAINEGYTIKTSRGFDPFTNMTPAKCAEECLRFQPACEGFVFNPDQDGGRCYLKTFGQPAQAKFLETRYQAEFSFEGWTYYWREGSQKFESFEQNKANLEKCFCPCKSEFRCVACSDSGCTDQI